MKVEELQAAEYRAKDNAMECLCEFVREARTLGWAPDAFLPKVAWRLANALKHAEAYIELRDKGRATQQK